MSIKAIGKVRKSVPIFDRDGVVCYSTEVEGLQLQSGTLLYSEHDVAKLVTERDAYRAVLVGAEYGMDGIDRMSVPVAQFLGQTVKSMTKEIIKERNELKVTVSEMQKQIDALLERLEFDWDDLK